MKGSYSKINYESILPDLLTEKPLTTSAVIIKYHEIPWNIIKHDKAA